MRSGREAKKAPSTKQKIAKKCFQHKFSHAPSSVFYIIAQAKKGE